MELNFIEKEEYHKGFEEHFKTKIQPKLSSLEEQRLVLLAQYKKRMPIGFFGALIATLIIITFFSQTDSLNIEDAWLMLTVVGSIAFYWVYTPKIKFKKLAKESIVKEIGQFFNLRYVPEQNLNTEPLVKSKLFANFNQSKSEDHFEGELEGLKFSLAEVDLEFKEGKNETEIFNGEIVQIEMLKKFNGHTIISEERQRTNISSGFFGIGGDSNYELVTLEDPVFENIYKIHSTDQVEARYLLTTSFMERVLKLREVMGNAKIKISFLDNQILLAISSYTDLFEPKGLEHTVYNLDDIYKFLEQINEYKKLIQVLKLNQNIGM